MSSRWKAPRKSPSEETLINKKIDECLADPAKVMALVRTNIDHIYQKVDEGKNVFFFRFETPKTLLEYLTSDNSVKVELTAVTWSEFHELNAKTNVRYSKENDRVIGIAKKLTDGYLTVLITSYGIHAVSAFQKRDEKTATTTK